MKLSTTKTTNATNYSLLFPHPKFHHQPIRLNFLFLILIVIIASQLLSQTLSHWSQLTTPFNWQTTQTAYHHSQYNLGNAEFYGNIDDDLLFSYAGYQYIHGADPSSINPETPYLGKYLYGLSILLFHNPIPIQYLLGLCLLLAVYYLTFQLTNHPTLSLISPLLLSFDQLFVNQLFQTRLDLPHALFITLSAIFFVPSISNPKHNPKKFLIVTSIFIGLVASTKLAITGFILWFSFILFTPQKLRPMINLTLPVVITYLSSYLVFFFYHPQPEAFIQTHLDTLRLYRAYVPEYPKAEILRIIFQGQWQTWWGSKALITVPEWSIFWPLSISTSLYLWLTLVQVKARGILTLSCQSITPRGIRNLTNYKSTPATPNQNPIYPITTFIFLYLLSNLTNLIFPRYLLSVLPLAIAVTVSFLSQFFTCRLK